MSTRCAPLVRISSGSPSALKIRLLAIAPTSQPSWAAAVAAVGAELRQLADLAVNSEGAKFAGDVLSIPVHRASLGTLG